MTRRRASSALTIALSVGLTLGLSLALAPAASAAELTVADPARDNQLPGLDIVGATLDNADYALTVEVNKDPTPLSRRVDFSLRGSAGDILPRLLAALPRPAPDGQQ